MCKDFSLVLYVFVIDMGYEHLGIKTGVRIFSHLWNSQLVCALLTDESLKDLVTLLPGIDLLLNS